MFSVSSQSKLLSSSYPPVHTQKTVFTDPRPAFTLGNNPDVRDCYTLDNCPFVDSSRQETYNSILETWCTARVKCRREYILRCRSLLKEIIPAFSLPSRSREWGWGHLALSSAGATSVWMGGKHDMLYPHPRLKNVHNTGKVDTGRIDVCTVYPFKHLGTIEESLDETGRPLEGLSLASVKGVMRTSHRDGGWCDIDHFLPVIWGTERLQILSTRSIETQMYGAAASRLFTPAHSTEMSGDFSYISAVPQALRHLVALNLNGQAESGFTHMAVGYGDLGGFVLPEGPVPTQISATFTPSSCTPYEPAPALVSSRSAIIVAFISDLTQRAALFALVPRNRLPDMELPSDAEESETHASQYPEGQRKHQREWKQFSLAAKRLRTAASDDDHPSMAPAYDVVALDMSADERHSVALCFDASGEPVNRSGLPFGIMEHLWMVRGVRPVAPSLDDPDKDCYEPIVPPRRHGRAFLTACFRVVTESHSLTQLPDALVRIISEFSDETLSRHHPARLANFLREYTFYENENARQDRWSTNEAFALPGASSHEYVMRRRTHTWRMEKN